jgi:hypothetical protein
MTAAAIAKLRKLGAALGLFIARLSERQSSG